MRSSPRPNCSSEAGNPFLRSATRKAPPEPRKERPTFTGASTRRPTSASSTWRCGTAPRSSARQSQALDRTPCRSEPTRHSIKSCARFVANDHHRGHPSNRREGSFPCQCQCPNGRGRRGPAGRRSLTLRSRVLSRVSAADSLRSRRSTVAVTPGLTPASAGRRWLVGSRDVAPGSRCPSRGGRRGRIECEQGNSEARREQHQRVLSGRRPRE